MDRRVVEKILGNCRSKRLPRIDNSRGRRFGGCMTIGRPSRNSFTLTGFGEAGRLGRTVSQGVAVAPEASCAAMLETRLRNLARCQELEAVPRFFL
jgi:hypothetical protein